MITLYIIIGFICLSLIVAFFRKIKIQGDVHEIYENVEQENDFYIDLLSKIVDHESFKILKEIQNDDSALQVVAFDWKVFNINNELPGALSTNNLKKVLKIITFMIDENAQWPLIKNKKEFYVLVENSDGKIGIGSIKLEHLKEYLDDVEIESFSILNT